MTIETVSDNIQQLLSLCPYVRQLCQPLQEAYAIKFFAYHVFDRDHKLPTYWLSNHSELYQYYYQQQLYLCCNELPDFRNGGIFYLDHYQQKNPATQSFAYCLAAIKQQFDVDHIVALVKHDMHSSKVYFFGVATQHTQFYRVFEVNQHDFNRFICYFRCSGKSLISSAKISQHSLLDLCSPHKLQLNFSSLDQKKHALANMHIRRYYLSGEYEGIYLTPHEALCLRLLSKQLNYMQIASELKISRFTIKRHMDNIRAKLDINNKKDLINALQEKGILATINNELIIGRARLADDSAISE